jgi:hypothetical protein
MNAVQAGNLEAGLAGAQSVTRLRRNRKIQR